MQKINTNPIKKLCFPSLPSLGYTLAILAGLLAALVHVIAKPIVESPEASISEINPVVFAFIIYFINGLFFTPIAKNSTSIRNLGKRNFFLLGIIGIAEVSGLIVYFFGLRESTAVNASIFSSSEIIISIMLAVLIFRERLQRRELTPFSMIRCKKTTPTQ